VHLIEQNWHELPDAPEKAVHPALELRDWFHEVFQSFL
jgi:hypothetical protein